MEPTDVQSDAWCQEETTNSLPLLFSPLPLRSLVPRNRIVVSPMCQYCSLDGGPTDWHLVHLGKSAIGGAAIVFGDETAVEARGRKTYDCAGIYDKRHVPQYRRITDFLKSLGAIPAIQLGHAGRKAGTRNAISGWAPLGAEDAAQGRPPWRAVSASAIPAGPGFPAPHALTPDEIPPLVRVWRDAAERALDAGFEICEIHGAHGYLIHQFLSPVSNKRNDAWGGDRQGRMRLALEITEAVRAVWPQDRPLFFRISAVDGRGGAWTLEDSIELSKGLQERGVDVIDCSSGGIQGDSMFPLVPRVPGYHAAYSSAIRREVGVATMTVGLITDPHHAEALLQEGCADLIALARGLMLESEWPVRAARELGLADPFSLLPAEYAYRLRTREESVKQYPEGAVVSIPLTQTRSVAYVWPRRREES